MRRSPKPGAFTAATFSTPWSLLITRAASNSPSKSSAMMMRGFPALATISRTGRKSRRLESFFSKKKIQGSSYSTVRVLGLLMK